VRTPLKRGRLYDALCKVGDHDPEPIVDNARQAKKQRDSLKGLRVLVAEDNPVNQRVALKMLSKLGCEAKAVETGLEALSIIGSDEFDVVLMDCQMPEMDGFEATRKVREIESTQNLPILALAANAMQGDKTRCLDAGMNDYLTKPIDLSSLSQALSRWSRRTDIDDRTLESGRAR
jgi:CheY-like chemotaxis protein